MALRRLALFFPFSSSGVRTSGFFQTGLPRLTSLGEVAAPVTAPAPPPMAAPASAPTGPPRAPIPAPVAAPAAAPPVVRSVLLVPQAARLVAKATAPSNLPIILASPPRIRGGYSPACRREPSSARNGATSPRWLGCASDDHPAL
ncbi:hypothetical protein DOO78_12710 [Roseicella frigidaeris]|uniref:Uncharacterized protein n=1 Tax=Roseicella frigidaeris TaxID=2230885 RepID=A0A327M5H9_9PROT|nr:hypothetical protein DOO78_12710 [Roseicella frigidaeris]